MFEKATQAKIKMKRNDSNKTVVKICKAPLSALQILLNCCFINDKCIRTPNFSKSNARINS